MKKLSWLSLAALTTLCLGLTAGCVPKTQYEDQQAKLDEAQRKLKAVEESSAECDKDMFLQLREQAQSLDLLTQELVDRNTELSKEVTRLRVFESATKSGNVTCDKRIADAEGECAGKVERTRITYEDLLKELKAENKKLQEANDKLKAQLESAEAAHKAKAKAPAKPKATATPKP